MKAIAVIVGLTALSILLLACDKQRSIRIENQTSSTVEIFENGVPDRTVAPGDVIDYGTVEFVGSNLIQIKSVCVGGQDCDRRVLAERSLTWDDYEDHPIISVR